MHAANMLSQVSFSKSLSPQAEWRLVHRLADAALPAVDRALRRALVSPEDETTWARVIEQLKNGNVNMAVDEVDLDVLAEGLVDKVVPLLQAIFNRAGGIIVGQLPKRNMLSKRAEKKPRPEPTRAKVTSSFNETNPHAQEWARQKAAKLVTGVTNETRRALRTLTTDAFVNGVPPRELARQMRQIVGLTERQAGAITRLRAELKADGLKAETVERRVEFAAERALRERALTIARTETMSASNAGQVEAWFQARSDGLLDADLMKEWIVTPDDRLCEECEPLDGVQVGLDQPFPGMVMEPPLHPNCRCAVGLNERK